MASEWQPEAVWPNAFVCSDGDHKTIRVQSCTNCHCIWSINVECIFLDLEGLECQTLDDGDCPHALLIRESYSSLEAAKEAAEIFVKGREQNGE
jgi:hypothetical protein